MSDYYLGAVYEYWVNVGTPRAKLVFIYSYFFIFSGKPPEPIWTTK